MTDIDVALKPSGQNTDFTSGELSWDEYLTQTKEMIAATRTDLNGSIPAKKIINANAPFEWYPDDPLSISHEPPGLLLIHGLYDCPYAMQAIGRYFQQKNFLVRSLLLPGHGTVPGDLLNIRLEAWQQATQYAIKSLQKETEQVFVLGFSTGAALALQQHLHGLDIAGLIMLAPALKIKNPFSAISNLPPYLSFLSYKLNWLGIGEHKDYAKYESFTFSSVYQVYRLTQQLKKLQALKSRAPIYYILTDDDAVINNQPALQNFKLDDNPKHQLLLYTNNMQQDFNDKRVELANSCYPEQNIVNFSHICLSIAPDDPHYGRYGDYTIYQQQKTGVDPKHQHLGELAIQRSLKKNFQRLNYNPDFDNLLKRLYRFVQAQL